jgi:hypothetical protein
MNVRKNTKRFGAVLGVVTCAVAMSACRYTGFLDAPSKSAAATATGWLVDQQQPDGGFELAGFAGFETSDAILAIAENAQQQAEWNITQARTAVRAVKTNGHDALHYIDDLVDDTTPPINAGGAAKVIVLVAKPLALGVTNFNPDGDTAKNLVAVVNGGAQPNGSYGTFNATAYAALAKKLVNGSVPANTVAFIRAGQEASGGWDFNGEPTGNEADVDSTSIAIQALAAAGVAPTDADLRAGLAYLADRQRADGAWESFGSPDPNSTSTAIFAITSAGFDPASPCWRNVVRPARTGQPYTSPMVWLRSQQNSGVPTPGDAGRINSPSDSFGVSTFATTQSIQAFRRGWNPVSPLEAQACP